MYVLCNLFNLFFRPTNELHMNNNGVLYDTDIILIFCAFVDLNNKLLKPFLYLY